MEIDTNKSSIKLIKNTRGYQWEIKIYAENEQEGVLALPNQLKVLDEAMRMRFSQEEDVNV